MLLKSVRVRISLVPLIGDKMIKNEEDDFDKIKERMIALNIFQVMNSKGCSHLKNNKLGIYCSLGTKRIRRLKKDGEDFIVCLDCNESRLDWIEVSKEEFDSIQEKNLKIEEKKYSKK